jgi:RHS repeat-associated protein
LDALGRRVQELRNGSVVRQFVYGFAQQPVAELTSSGTVRSEFIYVSGDIAPDYVQQGSTTLYLLHDQLGSVRKAIDVASGAVVQELEYDAHGVVTRNTNPGLQPFGYAGGLMDLDGRFVHFGARDYDARTGRWIEADPIGANGGENRYSYVGNDPVNNVDPSGLKPCPKKKFDKSKRNGPKKKDREKEKNDQEKTKHVSPHAAHSDGMDSPPLLGDPVAIFAGSLAGPVAGAFETGAAEIELSLVRNPVSAFFAGVGAGIAASQLNGTTGSVEVNFPSASGAAGFGFQVGQVIGYGWQIRHIFH